MTNSLSGLLVDVQAVSFIPDSFIRPARLWLLIGIAVLAVLYAVAQFRRRSYAVRFTNLELLDKVAPSRPGWRRHVPASIFLLAVAVLVVGFARPAKTIEVAEEQATIVMAIDTSLSMEATDVSPINRMESAKQAAIEFVEDLPDQMNVGLVAFNGIPSVRAQPTKNHAAVVAAIESLEVGPATAIGEAIFVSLDAVRSVSSEDGTPPPARIVLMSDGKTTVGRPDAEGIAAAQQEGIAISTIAFGTDEGIIILPESDGPVAVPVDTIKLREIADETGGEFFEATTTEELASVYRDIGSQLGTEEVKDEIGTTYTGMGLVLLLLTGSLSMLWFARLP